MRGLWTALWSAVIAWGATVPYVVNGYYYTTDSPYRAPYVPYTRYYSNVYTVPTAYYGGVYYGSGYPHWG